MKFVIFLGDGMSDRPLPELGNKTPLMVAKTPHLDRMVREGIGGWSLNTPEGYYPGSDIANLGVLGYDVRSGYTGRSPLEAAAMGVTLQPEDVAFRCNLVSLSEDFQVMADFAADHISTAEATELIHFVNEKLGNDQLSFYPGVSYRHLLVWHGGGEQLRCTPPHDISDRAIAGYLPVGTDAALIARLMQDSWTILPEHPINQKRRAAGRKPANSIWLWGQGRRPGLTPLREKFGISGGMISAVDLMRGIAVHIGMEVMHVPGATGWIDTDYQGKAAACLEGLTRHDLMFVHVEGIDESGHAGRLDYKIKAIEDFDAQVVGAVLDGLAARGTPFRALALPDHPTPIATKTHNSDPVPFALFGSGIVADHNHAYDEGLLQSGSHAFNPGHDMLPAILTWPGSGPRYATPPRKET
ncbi:MAG: cofactor-independent phosphoglycerate mutase [Magnetococcales bacterium]|nr:cofactor-independent phosphoglycerate mutase [Magnetococcales bacterium]